MLIGILQTGHAPDALRPVLAAMLRPDPADRLRSMDAVLDALAQGGAAPVAAAPSAAPKTPRRPLKLRSLGVPPFKLPPLRRPSRPVLVGGAAGVVLLGGLAAWLGGGGDPASPVRTAASGPPTADSGQTCRTTVP